MKPTVSNPIMLALLDALMGRTPHVLGGAKLIHKVKVKSNITAHKPHPGRHSRVVAKGFNTETNSWE